jgi:hypothetical protein
MGPRSHHMERLALVLPGAFAAGLVQPAYPKVVAKLGARGVELSWLGHLGVFALLVLLGLAGWGLLGVVPGAVAWVFGRATRRPDDPAGPGTTAARPRH